MVVMKLGGKNNTVAVVYSPGFGAGWSTWNTEFAEFLCMDSVIAACVLAGDIEGAITRAESVCPDIYPGGADDLRVEWLPDGTRFRIDEYDGSESVVVFDPADYMTA
jgi:hypothetical protein